MKKNQKGFSRKCHWNFFSEFVFFDHFLFDKVISWSQQDLTTCLNQSKRALFSHWNIQIILCYPTYSSIWPEYSKRTSGNSLNGFRSGLRRPLSHGVSKEGEHLYLPTNCVSHINFSNNLNLSVFYQFKQHFCKVYPGWV